MIRKLFLFFLLMWFCGRCLAQNDIALYLLQVKENDTVVTNFSDYKSLQHHLLKASEEVQSRGFFASYYNEPIKINDTIYSSRLVANHKTNIVHFRNWKEFSEISVDEKKEFVKAEELVEYLQGLNNQFSSQGSPFSKLRLKDFETINDTLSVSLRVSNLKPRTVDSLVVKGYPKFPLNYLKYYAGIKKGMLYNNEKVIRKASSLSNLPFISIIKPAEVLFNPDKTTLYLYVKKKNANNFDGFLGFSTNEESGKFELNGYLNLSLVNNLHFGETLNLAYKSDNEDQTQLNIKARLPYLFKSPLGVVGQMDIFRQKEAFSSTELRLGLNYALSSKSELLLGFTSTESADLSDDVGIAGVISQDFDASFLNMSYRFMNRQQSLLFPITTTFLIDTEIGNRQESLQEKVSQYKLQLRANHIFQINKRNSIYVQNETKYLNSNNYIANELFRFGGILSIRGFEENSLRASFFNVTNTEYRYQLSQTIYAHSIIDFAVIDNQAPKSSIDATSIGGDNLTSFGFGIGLITKSGLFKLNYANGTSRNIPFEFNNSKVHFSLTAFF